MAQFTSNLRKYLTGQPLSNVVDTTFGVLAGRTGGVAVKRHSSDRIRNVAVCGHGGTGKTYVVEAMLFAAKAIERLGRVEEGTTTTDFDAEEIRRRITISAALAPLEWKDAKINLIDTPGFPDFWETSAGDSRGGERADRRRRRGRRGRTEAIWALADEHSLAASSSSTGWTARTHLRADARQPAAGLDQDRSDPIADRRRSQVHRRRRPGDDEGVPRRECEPPRKMPAEPSRRPGRAGEAGRGGRRDRRRLTEVTSKGAVDGLRKGLPAAVRTGTLVPVLRRPARERRITPILDAIVRLLPARPSATRSGPREGEAVPVAPILRGRSRRSSSRRWPIPSSGSSRTSGSTRACSGPTRSLQRRQGPGRAARPALQLEVRTRSPPRSSPPATSAPSRSCRRGHRRHPDRQRPAVTLEPVEFPTRRPRGGPAEEQGRRRQGWQALPRLMEEDPALASHRANRRRRRLAGAGQPHVEVAVERLKRKFGVEVS